VLKALPPWIARMRLAVNRDPKNAYRLRKNVAALERPWRWPCQRDG
jgi:hypothetical protein